MRIIPNLTAAKSSNINFVGKRDVLAPIDWDGTFEDPKHPETRAVLEKGLADLRSEYADKGINFMPCIITARPKVRLMQKNPTSAVQWAITQNGGEITKGLPTPGAKEIPSWIALNESTGFDKKGVNDIVFSTAGEDEFSNLEVVTIAEVVHNPAASECEFMQPFCIKLDSIKLEDNESPEILTDKAYQTPKQIKGFIDKIEDKLKEQNIEFEVNQPYLFKGEPYLMFDVASPYANKGKALDFLMNELDVAPENVIVAGDGGNDIAMMKAAEGDKDGDGRNLIIVGPNKSLRQNASLLFNNKVVIRPADEPSSLGVLAGLKMNLQQIAERLNNSPSFTGLFKSAVNKADKLNKSDDAFVKTA